MGREVGLEVDLIWEEEHGDVEGSGGEGEEEFVVAV